jgi:hypothetical protein
MIDYIRVLLERYDKESDKGARRRFLRNVIRSSVKRNLDVIQILSNKNVRESSVDISKAVRCFSTTAQDLLVSLGLSPQDVLDGEVPNVAPGLSGPEKDSTHAKCSAEYFDAQSEVWLFEFAERKLHLLKELAIQDFNLGGLLKLKVRLDTITKALLALNKKLSKRAD